MTFSPPLTYMHSKWQSPPSSKQRRVEAVVVEQRAVDEDVAGRRSGRARRRSSSSALRPRTAWHGPQSPPRTVTSSDAPECEVARVDVLAAGCPRAARESRSRGAAASARRVPSCHALDREVVRTVAGALRSRGSARRASTPALRRGPGRRRSGPRLARVGDDLLLRVPAGGHLDDLARTRRRGTRARSWRRTRVRVRHVRGVGAVPARRTTRSRRRAGAGSSRAGVPRSTGSARRASRRHRPAPSARPHQDDEASSHRRDRSIGSAGPAERY